MGEEEEGEEGEEDLDEAEGEEGEGEGKFENEILFYKITKPSIKN